LTFSEGMTTRLYDGDGRISDALGMQGEWREKMEVKVGAECDAKR